jgi:lipid II:glycine glycyltransferase (peptidoglycan interpeptide bridge formation enzyme)
MRQQTRNRVLGLLERTYQTLKVNNEADLMAAHDKKKQEIEDLMQEWTLNKGNHARQEELLAKMRAAQRERVKLWKKALVQARKIETTLKEELALMRDIEDLKSALSSIPVRL